MQASLLKRWRGAGTAPHMSAPEPGLTRRPASHGSKNDGPVLFEWYLRVTQPPWAQSNVSGGCQDRRPLKPHSDWRREARPGLLAPPHVVRTSGSGSTALGEPINSTLRKAGQGQGQGQGMLGAQAGRSPGSARLLLEPGTSGRRVMKGGRRQQPLVPTCPERAQGGDRGARLLW